MPRDDRRVVHLFENEKNIKETSLPSRRTIDIRYRPLGILLVSGYYGWRNTLCGRKGTGLYVYTTEQLSEIPIRDDQERLCKNCLKTAEGSMRLLRMI